MNNFVSLEQSKRLKAAGWTAATEKIWAEFTGVQSLLCESDRFHPLVKGERCAAPSAAEIMEELARTNEFFEIQYHGGEWSVFVGNNTSVNIFQNKNLLAALVEAWCKSRTCPACNGEGWLWGKELIDPSEDTINDTQTKYTCDRCNGIGKQKGAGEYGTDKKQG